MLTCNLRGQESRFIIFWILPEKCSLGILFWPKKEGKKVFVLLLKKPFHKFMQ